MRHFSGRGGSLFLVGDPMRFVEAPLEDCGDGFDWRIADPSLRYWTEEESVIVEIERGEGWEQVDPVEVIHLSGRVSLARCYRGVRVRATGTCLPASATGDGASWEVAVNILVRNSSELGADELSTTSVPRGSSALVRSCALKRDLRGEMVLARLPVGRDELVGIGVIADSRDLNVHIEFDEKGVQYGSCRQ